MTLQEELKQDATGIDVQVEGAIHEFELPDASRDELFQFRHHPVERELTHWNVQRGQAEFASKGAAARGLDVDDAMGDVRIVIEGVGERQFRHVRQFRRNDLRRWLFTSQQLRADIRKL